MWTDAGSGTSTTKKKDLIWNLFRPSKGNLSASGRVFSWECSRCRCWIRPLSISGSDGSTVFSGIFFSSAEPAVMVKAEIMYPGRFKGQTPLRLRAAASSSKFKQKIGKTQRGEAQQQQGKAAGMRKNTAWQTLGVFSTWKEKKVEKSRGLLIFLLDYMRTDQALITRMPQERQHIPNKVL